MKKTNFLVILIILIIVLAGGFLFWKYEANKKMIGGISGFQECAAKGYPILESYPRQCQTPDGRTFTEDIGNALEKQNLIKVTAPLPNAVIRSPLTIAGEARGNWFFEAVFPVKLFDGNENEIARGLAQAKDDWMTENFVQFQAQIEFVRPSTEKGTLILEKDNPSGLPENADELIIPISFGD